mmetsp:Transcript_33022/g.72164  ORF Transcript_33022/g.72164 Transcript_33022/m.72164 type:complete len:292 (-) Transcript_33022:388-1263(-)
MGRSLQRRQPRQHQDTVHGALHAELEIADERDDTGGPERNVTESPSPLGILGQMFMLRCTTPPQFITVRAPKLMSKMVQVGVQLRNVRILVVTHAMLPCPHVRRSVCGTNHLAQIIHSGKPRDRKMAAIMQHRGSRKPVRDRKDDQTPPIPMDPSPVSQQHGSEAAPHNSQRRPRCNPRHPLRPEIISHCLGDLCCEPVLLPSEVGLDTFVIHVVLLEDFGRQLGQVVALKQRCAFLTLPKRDSSATSRVLRDVRRQIISLAMNVPIPITGVSGPLPHSLITQWCLGVVLH